MTLLGMSLLTMITALAASGAVLALLHRLRVRPREEKVITTLFWRQAAEKTRARSLMKRFRHPMVFLFLFLICCLLILALAKPEPKDEMVRRVHEIQILDISPSMERVWDRAGELVKRNGSTCLILAGSSPQLVHSFEDPVSLITQRLNQAAFSKTPGDIRQAVMLAKSLSNGRANPKITLITNRALDEGLTRIFPPDFQVLTVGSPEPNWALLSALFEPDPENPFQGALKVRVGYWGEDPREVTLFLSTPSKPNLFQQSQILHPGQTHSFVSPKIPANGESVRIQAEPRDSNMADNAFTYDLPVRNPIRIGLDPESPPLLKRLLQCDPVVRLTPMDQPKDLQISIPTGGPAIPVGTKGPMGSILGPGAALKPMPPLLKAGPFVLAGMDSKTLYLAPGIFAKGASLLNKSEFALFLAKTIRRLGEWEEDPIGVGYKRIYNDPLFEADHGFPGDRGSSNLFDQPKGLNRESPAETLGLEIFEILLLCALGCMVVESFLVLTGRIP